MNFVAVVIIVICIYTFANKYKVKRLELLEQNELIKSEAKIVIDKLKICVYDKDKNITCKREGIGYALYLPYEYYQHKGIQDVDVIVANYVNVNKKACKFKMEYIYKVEKEDKGYNKLSQKWNKCLKDSLTMFYINVINYIRIFERTTDYEDMLLTNDIVIVQDDIDNDVEYTNEEEKTTISEFFPSYIISEYRQKVTLREIIKRLNINNVKFGTVVSIWLYLGISGYMFVNGATSLLHILSNNYTSQDFTAVILYLCYVYIINLVYSPVGKYKWLYKLITPFLSIFAIMCVCFYFLKKTFKKFAKDTHIL